MLHVATAALTLTAVISAGLTTSAAAAARQDDAAIAQSGLVTASDLGATWTETPSQPSATAPLSTFDAPGCKRFQPTFDLFAGHLAGTTTAKSAVYTRRWREAGKRDHGLRVGSHRRTGSSKSVRVTVSDRTLSLPVRHEVGLAFTISLRLKGGSRTALNSSIDVVRVGRALSAFNVVANGKPGKVSPDQLMPSLRRLQAALAG